MVARMTRGVGTALALAAFVGQVSVAQAAATDGYGFANAAQEITQLYWLADTAQACGWASGEEAIRFKAFSVRFLSAHLSDLDQTALLSMVTQNGYEDQVRRAAIGAAQQNCESTRWHTGWVAYKAAADERGQDF
jgi:hypothetical protein